MVKVIYKSKDLLLKLQDSGKYLTELLYLIYEKAKPGVSGIELEEIAQDFINKYNLKGAFKGYMGYPANLCFSVNDCVVHGIPSDYILKEGDLLKIDAGINYKGAISDAAWSKVIGGEDKNPQAAKLTRTTKKALDVGVETLEVGKSFYNLGKAIYNTMKKEGFEVIRDLCGHGVGIKVHEPPYIYNYPHKDLKNLILKNGMSFAIEPITAEKSTSFVEKQPGGWDLLCAKGDLGAQWEYTCAVIDGELKIIAGIQEDIFESGYGKKCVIL